MEVVARRYHEYNAYEVSQLSQTQTLLIVSSRPQRTAIASAIGDFRNLGGIPSLPNGSKQGAFRAALNKTTFTSRLAKYIVNGNQNYLKDRRGGIFMVIANVGTQLGAAASGGAQGAIGEAVFDAWSTFAQGIYDQATSLLVGGV